ncbi:MAG: YncE family protein [Gemmatimonadota bacterium]
MRRGCAGAETDAGRRRGPAAIAGLALALWAGALTARPAEAQVYRVYVASESEDEVTVLRYEAGGSLEVEKVVRVGRWPAEIEGPHGIYFDPSGDWWYLTLGHGYPNGTLLKYEAGADTVVGTSELGLFPATVSLTPEGALAFIVNSNFYGDHVPSTLSIVDTHTMDEVAQTETCTMPHGSRMSPDGMYNYSACMMDDQLVEMSTVSLEVTRRLDLVTGAEVRVDGAHDMHAMHDMSGGAPAGGGMQVCSPTWTAPTDDGTRLYVACNKSHEIVEVDLADWSVVRRIPAQGAPYNLALTPDGSRLLATLKGSAHLAVFDRASGRELARIDSGQKVTHGVVVTPDSRYALVTVEGIGGEPGLVEVIDLETYTRVARAEVGKQAGGLALVP